MIGLARCANLARVQRAPGRGRRPAKVPAVLDAERGATQQRDASVRWGIRLQIEFLLALPMRVALGIVSRIYVTRPRPLAVLLFGHQLKTRHLIISIGPVKTVKPRTSLMKQSQPLKLRTLAGTGSCNGVVTNNAGGTLSPGKGGIGTLTLTNAVVLNTGSTLRQPHQDRAVQAGLHARGRRGEVERGLLGGPLDGWGMAKSARAQGRQLQSAPGCQ